MGIEKNYLDVMGPIFCECIRPMLQSDGFWNMDVRHAWLHLFRIVVLKIKRGYGEFSESFSGHLTYSDGEEDTPARDENDEEEGVVNGVKGQKRSKSRLQKSNRLARNGGRVEHKSSGSNRETKQD